MHLHIDGQEFGPIEPHAEQAHLADLFIRQRGIFAIGRFFATRVADEMPSAVGTAEVLR